MKGLLLKDFYAAGKYCRVFPIIVVVFIALSLTCEGYMLMGEGNMFFLLYPIILVSMIPVTLLGYDERDRWTGYSVALPYTRGQLVSAKYLVGLCFSGGVFLLSIAATLVQMEMNGSFSLEKLAVLSVTLLVLACLCPAILLPFTFKYGVEKGRFAYYIAIGVCGGVGAVLVSAGFEIPAFINSFWILGVVAGVSVLLYALSWWLSIRFYQKRDL